MFGHHDKCFDLEVNSVTVQHCIKDDVASYRRHYLTMEGVESDEQRPLSVLNMRQIASILVLVFQ
jgi:hypothetical protein